MRLLRYFKREREREREGLERLSDILSDFKRDRDGN